MNLSVNGPNYIVRVPVSQRDEIKRLMAYRGLVFSTSASSRNEAVLFTTNPYAVADLSEGPVLEAYRRQIELSRALDGIGTHRLPPGKELWPYQRAALDYIIERKGGLLGQQPGLGKTPMAIAFANHFEASRNLVIVPASLRIQWGERIKEWSTIPNVRVSVMLNAKDGIHPTAHYQVISYNAATNPAILRAISKYEWDVLVCDEIHNLKTPEAIRTRAILGNSRGEFQHGDVKMKAIGGHCRMHLGLTGTPLLNRPSECFGASTQVLTQKGWKAIVDVETSDKLWDGEEWVEHTGLLYQGCVSTVSVGQISVTETHNFLGKYSWVSAGEACLNMDLWNQILEKGSENLPFKKWGNSLAALNMWCVRVIAEVKHAPRFKNFAKVQFSGADHVAQKTAMASLRICVRALIQNCVKDFSHLSKPLKTVAKIRNVNITNIMVGEESASINLGRRTGRCFWNILFRFHQWKFLVLNWTGSTMIKDMSREISGSLVRERTKPISGRFQTFKKNWILHCKKSNGYEPVYDLANAGPRQRFTILTCDGPVIAHNCFTLIRHFDHEAIDFMGWDKFKETYNRQADMRTIQGKRFKLESTSLETELQNRLRVHFMSRHMKADVLKDMKPPRYNLVRCMENGAVKGALDAEGMLGLSIEEVQTTKDFEILGHIAEARRLMGTALAPQIVDYAADFLEGSDEKLVIFAWHIDVLDLLEKGLSRFGTVRVDGSKSVTARQKAVDSFVEKDDVRVYIANMLAGGIGTDGLQKVCSRVYLAEPDWVPANNEQAVARLDRIGQENLVSAEIFVAPGSISEKILVKALEKMNVIHRVLDEREGKKK